MRELETVTTTRTVRTREELDAMTALYAERFEAWRARGEDWGTASEWATQDVEAKYGRL